MNSEMSLAERLKAAREFLGKSQKEIAVAIGASSRAWQDYEAGISVPGGKVFEALVRLGFNANWLLTGEGEMRRGEKEHNGKNLVVSEPGAVYNASDFELREICDWLKVNPGDKKLILKLVKSRKLAKEALEGFGMKDI